MYIGYRRLISAVYGNLENNEFPYESWNFQLLNDNFIFPYKYATLSRNLKLSTKSKVRNYHTLLARDTLKE